MSADPQVFLMVEEVGEYQGAYKVTKGLLEKYGSERVLDTPITEAGFAGIRVGAAYYGLRPVVEFMTFNFSMQAIDHIINSAAKMNYMSAGDISVPIVFRGPNGAAAGGKQRFNEKERMSRSLLFQKWLAMLFRLQRGFPRKGLVPRPPDRGMIDASVRKTSRLVSVEEGFPQHGVGAEIRASVIEESFEYLDVPVETIAGADVPTPYAANLERLAVPQVDDIVNAVKRACNRSVPLAAAA